MPNSKSGRLKAGRYLFLLIIVTVFVYLNSFNNTFVWDDLNNIVNNERLEGPVTVRDVFLKSPMPPARFYRPIPFLTIILDHSLWGKNVFGYHLTNLLFHIFNVLMVFYICGKLTGSRGVSLGCAVLFAVHPVQTEAVTYISGRSDPICAFFLFSSFYLYIKYSNPASRNKLVFLTGALSLFLLGLLSKEIALIFPLILFSYDALFLNSPLNERVKRNIPFVLLTTGFLLFRYIFVKWQPGDVSFGQVYLLPGILLSYLKLLFFPFNLHMQHNLEENGLLFFLIPAIIVVIFLYGILKKFHTIRGCMKETGFLQYLGAPQRGTSPPLDKLRAERAFNLCVAISMVPKNRVLLFGLFWFLISLLPFLGILKLNSDMAEHWLYLASFGFFLMVSGVLMHGNIIRAKIALLVLILFLGFLTIQRNFVWRDDMSIYKDTLKYRPHDHRLHYNLGNAYLRRGLLDEALKEYRLILELNPDHPYALNNIGLIFEKKNVLKQAYQFYNDAAVISPGLEVARKNLLNLEFISSAFAGEEAYFDHSLYGDVLAKFLRDGNVDYTGLKNTPSILDAYLKKVSELNPDALTSMPQNEKLAFYLNVYNAMTLKVIIENCPVKSIKDISGVWDKIKFNVAGKERTLNNIEHDILRKEFHEPRIHFALVCASKGCSELANEPFSGKELNEQLDREARKFVNDKTKVRLDRDNRTLYLSSIFKWFIEDFGDAVQFISRYMPEDDSRFIRDVRPKIKYLNYDWSLNERKMEGLLE